MLRSLQLVSSLTTKTAIRVDRTIKSVKLAEFGARPAVISALTDIPLEQAKSIYLEIQGVPAKQGRKCSSLDSFIRNTQQRLQISLLVTNYLRAKNYGIDKAKAIILSYDDFLKSCPGTDRTDRSFITIDRAYQIIQSVTIEKTHSLTICTACNSSHFYNQLELVNEIKCPVCLTKPIIVERRMLQREHEPQQSQLKFATSSY